MDPSHPERQPQEALKNAVVDVSVPSDGSDQERENQKGKNVPPRVVVPKPHRRLKSLPVGGYTPASPSVYQQSGSARAAGPMDFVPQQMPVFHPWVSGFDPQWSAYGMYVHSTVMAKRSEKPTRVVFIGNLSPSAKEKTVIDAASKFGGLRGVDASLREYWFGMFVSYWDTRHAEEAVRGLPEMVPGVGSDDVHKIPCSTCFMIPPTAPGMENQGLLTVKIEENVTSTMIRRLFSKFGDVKSVRTVNEGAKAVEFFDARAAEAALMEIKSSPEHRPVVKHVEFASVAPSEQTNAFFSKSDEPTTSEGEATTPVQWPMPSSPYPSSWGQYPLAQPFAGEHLPLQRQHSAPAGNYSDPYALPRPDAIWPGHYMGYPPHGKTPPSSSIWIKSFCRHAALALRWWTSSGRTIGSTTGSWNPSC